jgi:hypothetical protein
MSTGEGPAAPRDAEADRPDREDRSRRGERIGVGGGDDSVIRIQLAARWAESYGPNGDSLGAVLKRFRATYEYLDSVTHGVEPPELTADMAGMPRPAQASPAAPPPVSAPPPPPPPGQSSEAKPWT